MEEHEREAFFSKNTALSSSEHSNHESPIELKSYSSGLKWVFLDYSSLWQAGLSWSIFFLLNIGVPLVSHFLFSCSNCDAKHQRPYDTIVQLSLSVFTALSFISLSTFGRKYGVRKFLFLDKVAYESDKVREGYTQQLHVSFCIPFPDFHFYYMVIHFVSILRKYGTENVREIYTFK